MRSSRVNKYVLLLLLILLLVGFYILTIFYRKDKQMPSQKTVSLTTSCSRYIHVSALLDTTIHTATLYLDQYPVKLCPLPINPNANADLVITNVHGQALYQTHVSIPETGGVEQFSSNGKISGHTIPNEHPLVAVFVPEPLVASSPNGLIFVFKIAGQVVATRSL